MARIEAAATRVITAYIWAGLFDTPMPESAVTEGPKVGYRWYEAEGIDPLFAFGHGLTYTTFRYSDLRVRPLVVAGRSEIKITFRLRNPVQGRHGDRAGLPRTTPVDG